MNGRRPGSKFVHAWNDLPGQKEYLLTACNWQDYRTSVEATLQPVDCPRCKKDGEAPHG